ncbi:MAG: arylamine N-acetyltransferase family protein [Acidimicrobiales bacterium]
MSPLASLEAYLDRIGLPDDARPRLADVHRAHATSISFENFDPFSGTPVSLEVEDLEDKFVTRGRGGYCFEHNLLLKAALESLGGTQVSPMLARVRLGPEGSPRPLNHLLLRVRDRDGTWLADVGFGGGGLLDPVPFETGVESEQSGWRYRLVEDGAELVLQVFQDGGWNDMYGFAPEPAEPVDIVVNNWFTATHPDSPFVTGIMVGVRRPERCLSLFVYEQAVLVERPVGGGSTVTEVPLDTVPALLAERFDIHAVALGDDGRLLLETAGG